MIRVNAVQVLIVYLIYICCFCSGYISEDYYWRDYFGTTPGDALKGGRDRNGKPIYVGQVLHDNKLIPGKIYENASEIHIEFHDARVLREAIKILCTQYPEAFEWIETRYDGVLEQKLYHTLFEGGYESGYTTYVGRAESHGELTVGKVICHGAGCYKLTTIEGAKWYKYAVYEILTYNAKAKRKSTTTSTTTTTTTTSTTSKPVTFYTEVYRRQPPTVVVESSTAEEKQTTEISAKATDHPTTTTDSETFYFIDSTPSGYNSAGLQIIRHSSFYLLVVYWILA